MHTDLEDFNTGWFGVSIGMKATEIDKLIENLELLKEDENQHFHLSGDFDGEGGVGDIEIYIQGKDETDNMSITGLAISPNR